MVKLWVAGAWRAITIDDRMPVDANGYLVIANSTTSREIWPSLLAKALYKLYSMSSFGVTHQDLLHGTMGAVKDVEGPSSTGVGSFVAFVVQALSGWLPDVMGSSEGGGFDIGALVAGGTPKQPANKFSVDFECQKLARLLKMSSKKKSKKKKKKEVTPEELAEAKERRTANIASIHGMLASPRPQVFMVCFAEELRKEAISPPQTLAAAEGSPEVTAAEGGDAANPEVTGAEGGDANPEVTASAPAAEETAPPPVTPSAKFTIYPVLAVGMHDNHADAEPQLLLEWAPKDEVPNPMADEPPPIYWATSSELVAAGAVLVQMHTLTDMSSVEHMHYHWTSSADAADATPEDASALAYPGPVPPQCVYVAGGSSRVAMSLTCDPDGAADFQNHASVALQEVPLPWSPFEAAAARPKPLRINLQKQTLQPFSTLTAELPPATDDVGHLYKVSLNAPAGAAVTFASSTALEVGTTADVWKKVGGYVAVAEGTYDAVTADYWQVIFRRIFTAPEPLEIKPESPAAAEGEGEGEGGGEGEEAAKEGGEAAAAEAEEKAAEEGEAQPADVEAAAAAEGEADPAMAEDAAAAESPPSTFREFLIRLQVEVPDSDAAPFMRIVTIDNDTGVETVHPLLETAYMPWAKNEKGYTVMLVAYTPRYELAAGSWKMTALTSLPLEGEEAVAAGIEEVPCGTTTQFSGVYTPNKYRRLFRDVLVSEDATYKLALRLALVDPSLYVRLEVFDAKSLELVCSVRGRKAVTLHSIVIPSGAGEEGLIVEATLDNEFMEMPAALVSRYPYYFSEMTEPPEGSEMPGWTMTVVSSVDVTLTHDVAQEAAFAKVSGAWEEEKPGRAERAAGLRALYLAEAAKAEGGAEGDDTPLEKRRADALGADMVEPELEAMRVARRPELPAVKEATAEASGPPELMDEAALSARADAHSEEMVASKENLEGVDNGVAAYHESLKGQFADQASKMGDLRSKAVADYTEVMLRRAQYRQSCEDKIEALTFLKEKGEEAVEISNQPEGEKGAKGKKPAKGKKK